MEKGFVFREIYYNTIRQMDEYNQIKFYDAICIFKRFKNLIDSDMTIPTDDIIIEE